MEVVNLKAIDFTNPTEVLCSFFAEMNRWEVEAWKLLKQSGDSENEKSWSEIQMSWKPIFEEFCTKKKRVYGSHRSLSRPLTYDPQNEEILNINYDKTDKVVIKTTRKKGFPQEFCYVLFKKNNKWLIDNKYYFGSDEKIVRVIL